MEQIKRRWRDLPLRKALMAYIAAAALLAILLCLATRDLCDLGAQKIRSSYPDDMKKYYLVSEEGERLGEGAYIGKDVVPLSAADRRAVELLGALPGVMTPVYSGGCILAAALLFYRDKLKGPLAQLRLASEKISRNELDFTVAAHSGDELGQLCTSFETMRAALAQNFADMWRQMEERKCLGAAFAHDLRTPLTVLKGYDEMLQISGDGQTRAVAVTMGEHIARLEHYVETMSQLHRMEDARPHRRQTPLAALATSLEESAGMVCRQAGKRFALKNRVTSPELSLDGDFILQVHSNLISNAVRYAGTSVTLFLEETPEGLALSVEDDGPGFDESAMEKAAAPYFTGEKGAHFGLGLFICKILCEHHGGWLKVGNGPVGAKVTAFFKNR